MFYGINYIREHYERHYAESVIIEQIHKLIIALNDSFFKRITVA